ncbi:MAG: hypothetical protein ACR2HD_11775 [Solirubrobacteraceae bacterium]|nr:MAG: hypothetical protein DLM63_12295 [Solirubrobacterales bacterium]
MDDATAALDRFMASLEGDARQLAAGEWGLTIEAGGFELEVGIAIRGGLLRAQAAVLPAGVTDPHQLLFWNRQAPLVCFAQNGAGEVFVMGELPLQAVVPATLDIFLGVLVATAGRAREQAVASTPAPSSELPPTG